MFHLPAGVVHDPWFDKPLDKPFNKLRIPSKSFERVRAYGNFERMRGHDKVMSHFLSYFTTRFYSN